MGSTQASGKHGREGRAGSLTTFSKQVGAQSASLQRAKLKRTVPVQNIGAEADDESHYLIAWQGL